MKNMEQYIITERNQAVYFQLFQHHKFKTYINPSISKENFPHFNSNFFNLTDFYLAGFHQRDEIMSIGFVGLYGYNQKHWALSYINVHPKHIKKGLGKKTFDLLESLCPDKMRLTGFTPDGFLYLRPYLKKKGYEVKDRVDFWPSDWDWNKIDEWNAKYLKG